MESKIIEIFNKIVYNVLSALYQPFWAAVLLAFLTMFLYLYEMCIRDRYISKRFETNVAARVHRGFLEEKYGKENIFVIDMRPNKEERRDKYICFGKYKNKIKRIGRWIQGNTMYQSKKIINEICEIVRKYNIKFIFIEDSTFGNVVKEIKCRYPETQIVTFYHDIAVELYAEWALSLIHI